MSEQKEFVFAKGIYVDKPSPKAPHTLIAKLSFKVPEAVAWLQANENNAGYCKMDVWLSKDGQKYFAALDDFKPEKPEGLKEPVEEENEKDLIPTPIHGKERRTV